MFICANQYMEINAPCDLPLTSRQLRKSLQPFTPTSRSQNHSLYIRGYHTPQSSTHQTSKGYAHCDCDYTTQKQSVVVHVWIGRIPLLMVAVALSPGSGGHGQHGSVVDAAAKPAKTSAEVARMRRVCILAVDSSLVRCASPQMLFLYATLFLLGKFRMNTPLSECILAAWQLTLGRRRTRSFRQ